MDERLYRLRPDQAVFETGTAQGKQLLLSFTVREISLHWFAPDGAFLELERIPVEPATMPPGHRVWQAGKVVAEGLHWEERVERQLAALKERLGFVPCDILIRKFESEEAGIFDLPGEYVQFLENAEEYSEEDRQAFEAYIQKWRQARDFVLVYNEEYWMNEAGEVTHF
jgi:hypothetical protein